MDCGVRSSLNDLKSPKFWRGCFGEVLATFLLIFIGCGTAIPETPGSPAKDSQLVRVSLSFAVLVGLLVWTFGNVSGAHLNPSVTLAQWLTRRISMVRCFFYIICQCGGCSLGALSLKNILSAKRLLSQTNSTLLGATELAGDVVQKDAIAVEIIITFTLVVTVFAVTDQGRKDVGQGLAPLAISFAILTTLLFAIPLTGASLNPARSFGPTLVLGKWKDHWVFWVGPIAGGILAGFLYDFLLAPNASLEKMKNFFTDPDYQPHTNYDDESSIIIINRNEDFSRENPAYIGNEGNEEQKYIKNQKF